MVAPSTVEVVSHAGGWLFDQAMAGWDATVLTADRAGSRPLRILGARAADLEPVLAAQAAQQRGPRAHAFAVRADLFESDVRVRRMVLEALDEGRADVRFWSGRWPSGPDGGTGAVRHRLSVAARAFKAQALVAACAPAAPGEVGQTTELFRTGRSLLRSGSA